MLELGPEEQVVYPYKEVIYTKRELLKRATAALLEEDAQNGQNKYPLSWIFYALGGYRKGADAVTEIWERGKNKGEELQEKWMILASWSFSPEQIRNAFKDPVLFDKATKHYQEVWEQQYGPELDANAKDNNNR